MRTPPQWIIEEFVAQDYVQLQMDFCGLFFTKNEYNIELFPITSDKRIESWRAFATVDGDTYITTSSAFIWKEGNVKTYLNEIEPRLEQLLACL